ncbi:MAG TPA: lantibiotic dehydratase [Actinophytocola sp.]|nr:lantibiotic dehydratase [Actinophytocola sp.]
MTAVTAAPAQPLAGMDWVLPPLFLLRVAGLPFDVVEGLRFTDGVAWAEEVLAAEDVIAAAAGPLADALEVAVATHKEDAARRRLLINLRRAVFNGRSTRDGAAAVELLSQETAAMLRDWLAATERRDELVRAGASLFDTETAARRDTLRELAARPELRCGVLLSSPSLDRYLNTYLNAGPGKLGKRARRIERSVLEYLYRTACKTSPFSTLTGVSLGTFAPAGGTGAAVLADRAGEPVAAVRLSVAVLSRLAAILRADPSVRADLPVRATAGWRVDRDKVRYLRRQRSLGEDDEDAAVTIDPVSETLFYLPTGAMLADVLATLPAGTTLPMAELAARLSEVSDRDPADVAEYLAHLLRLGLLVVPELQVDIHDPDPLGSFLAGLRRLDRPWADGLADRLTRVGQAVDEYPGAQLDRRRELLDVARTELKGAHADTGREDVPVPRTLVYEDTAVPATRVVGDLDVWERRLLPQLRELCRILPAFDMNVSRRLATKGFFLARYGSGGTCSDFLSFAHEYQQDFYEHFSMRQMRRRAFDEDNNYVRQENWFKQSEIEGLDDARCAAADRMDAAHAKLPADATELRLDNSFVDSVAGHVPETLGVLDPRSFFMQVADSGDGEPLAVVNRVYSGLTLLFSRFAHLFADGGPAGPAEGEPDLVARLRSALVDLQPPGAVFAELRGGHDATNLNLHPAVTGYEIVCPGEISNRPAEEQISVEDLVITDVGDRLTLRSTRLGVEVIPVYLGFLLPMALPDVQQVLLTFSYTGMASLDLWAGTSVPLPGNTIASYPRVRFGDVVLQRRMWKLHPDYLPQREADDTDATWFLRWRRWQRDNGLPRRVFATPDGAGSGGAPVDHKPLYVDFDSAFSLGLLDALGKAAGDRLAMTEMLPGPDELWLRDGDDRYVTELTMELDGVRRTR